MTKEQWVERHNRAAATYRFNPPDKTPIPFYPDWHNKSMSEPKPDDR